MIRHLSAYSLWPAGSIPTDSFTVESVPLSTGKQIPAGRFIGAFGFQGVLGLFRQLRRTYRSDTVLRIDISVILPDQPMTVVSSRLAESMSLHVGYISRTIEAELRQIIDDRTFRTLSEIILEEPMVLNKIWEHPDFSHIKMICWNAPTTENPKFQMGALAGPRVVDSVSVLDAPSLSATLKF